MRFSIRSVVLRRVITQPVIWLGACLLLLMLPHGLFLDHEVTRRVALALLVSLGLAMKAVEKWRLPSSSTNAMAPWLLLVFLALALWRAVHGLAPWYGFYETFWLATLGGLALLVWERPLPVRTLAWGVAGLGLAAALGARVVGGQWGLSATMALDGLLQQANATAHLMALGAVGALMLAMETGRAGNLPIAASFFSKSPHRSLSPLGRGWREAPKDEKAPPLPPLPHWGEGWGNGRGRGSWASGSPLGLPGAPSGAAAPRVNQKQKNAILTFLNQSQRPLALALALLLVSQLPAQQSKAAWLSLGAGAMGVMLWRLPVVWRGMLLVLGGAARGGAVVYFGRGEALQESRSQRERAWMAANAAYLVLDQPLLGHGPGQFPATNLLISPRVIARHPRLQPHAVGVALTPHTEPLAIAHDWGLPGLMLLLWLLILRWPKLKGREPLLLALGVLALVDFPFHLAPLALLAVLVVFADHGGGDTTATPERQTAMDGDTAAGPERAPTPPPATSPAPPSRLAHATPSPLEGEGFQQKTNTTFFLLHAVPHLALAIGLLAMALGVATVERRTFTGDRDADYDTLAQASFLGLTHPYAAKRAGVLLLTPLGEAWIEDAPARHRAAVRWLSLAARQGRGTASTLNNLGVALKRTGKLPEALVALKAATALEPAYCLAYDNAAGVALLLGEKGEAEQQAIAYRACLTRHRG